MADSKIEWTDKTWNPTLGCSKVSPGCTHCYAIRQARRFDKPGGIFEGTTTAEPNWSGRINLLPQRLEEPFRWRKPCRVFVDSMSDLFHEKVPTEFIDRVFAVMAHTPRHTYQILTKRPERMRAYLTEPNVRGRIYAAARKWTGVVGSEWSGSPLDPLPWPIPNVWLGTSVENQEAADERIPNLLATPAAVRFLSCEPLLGAVDLEAFLMEAVPLLAGDADVVPRRDGLSWVIGGGESGPGARPMHPAWARSIRDQCKAASVAFFFKQHGDWAPGAKFEPGHKLQETKVAQSVTHVFPDGQAMVRVGKKQAGRVLDGRTWDEFPGVKA